jgi:hypothetical protein
MNKGQLISLDFIMSLILVVIAIGITMQLSEIENYNFKDKQLKDETQIRGKTAAALLVNSPRTTCELVDYRDENKIISYISNCLPEFDLALSECGGSEAACKAWDKYGINHRTFKPILKEFLGLPESYSCYIKVTGGRANPSENAVLLSDCESSPPALAKNIYAVDLNVVVHNKGDITGKTLTVDKNELEHCINQETNCFMYPATIKFLVWRNE